uniref:Uncharacterized protein n=1 Tax=Canis lupus familiaris TaxID=9615 RepID=A0A8C0NKH1_CANLF
KRPGTRGELTLPRSGAAARAHLSSGGGRKGGDLGSPPRARPGRGWPSPTAAGLPRFGGRGLALAELRSSGSTPPPPAGARPVPSVVGVGSASASAGAQRGDAARRQQPDGLEAEETMECLQEFPEHHKMILDRLNEQREQDRFTDITLIVDGGYGGGQSIEFVASVL